MVVGSDTVVVAVVVVNLVDVVALAVVIGSTKVVVVPAEAVGQ